MTELSRVQQLHLDVLRTVSFNELDGARVADDLLAHRALWEACFLARIGWAYPHITAYDTLYHLDHHLAYLIAAATGAPADRAALLSFELVDLVAQALVLRPQRGELGRLRLDHVAQQVQDAPRLWVRDPAQIHLVQHPHATPPYPYSSTPVYLPPCF